MEQPKPAEGHPPEPEAPSTVRAPIAEAPAAPPTPLARRLREGAGDLLFALRRGAVESWRDFRRLDRHFQWKAGVVAAWALTSLVAIRIAMASPTDLASNGLQAYVAMNQTTMSWGLLVHNRSDEPWNAVRVILDDGWVHERPAIGAGERVVLSPEDFRRAGEAAPADLGIASVRIETRGGTAAPTLVR